VARLVGGHRVRQVRGLLALAEEVLRRTDAQADAVVAEIRLRVGVPVQRDAPLLRVEALADLDGGHGVAGLAPGALAQALVDALVVGEVPDRAGARVEEDRLVRALFADEAADGHVEVFPVGVEVQGQLLPVNQVRAPAAAVEVEVVGVEGSHDRVEAVQDLFHAARLRDEPRVVEPQVRVAVEDPAGLVEADEPVRVGLHQVALGVGGPGPRVEAHLQARRDRVELLDEVPGPRRVDALAIWAGRHALDGEVAPEAVDVERDFHCADIEHGQAAPGGVEDVLAGLGQRRQLDRPAGDEVLGPGRPVAGLRVPGLHLRQMPVEAIQVGIGAFKQHELGLDVLRLPAAQVPHAQAHLPAVGRVGWRVVLRLGPTGGDGAGVATVDAVAELADAQAPVVA